MKALGEAASELLWMRPSAACLIALTHPEPDWNVVSRDPAAVLLVLRAQSATTNAPVYNLPAAIEKTSQYCTQPIVLQTALTLMHQDGRYSVAWDKPGCDVIYRHCWQFARLAQSLAARIPRCDGERAWIAGLLAPLGWLAICAVDSERVPAVLLDFAQSDKQSRWQHQTWGLDHAALVRRLSRRWSLPSWLAAVIGHLGLPVEIAVGLGAEPTLFQVVQLAVALRQRHECALALPIGAEVEELLNALDLSKMEAERAVQASRELPLADYSATRSPSKQQLLNQLLQSALDVRIAACNAASACVSRVKDYQTTAERLQAQKMAALAELAAGAGHEINNPLAVISGQAQYIARQLEHAQCLATEEPALAEYVTALQTGIQRSLKTIRGQSKRIHHVLTNLMQFARPRPPQPRIVTVREVLREAVATIQDLALTRKVRLVCQDIPDSWRVRIDAAQTGAALGCLLRNAVEAAPPDGWVELRAEQAERGLLNLLVEDNGPGPGDYALEHMFDPFYSGRAAGRGQGLGLPIAWRLARQQGGDVSFAGHADGITRFILTLTGLESGYSAPDTTGQAQGPAAEANSTSLYRHDYLAASLTPDS